MSHILRDIAFTILYHTINMSDKDPDAPWENDFNLSSLPDITTDLLEAINLSDHHNSHIKLTHHLAQSPSSIPPHVKSYLWLVLACNDSLDVRPRSQPSSVTL